MLQRTLLLLLALTLAVFVGCANPNSSSGGDDTSDGAVTGVTLSEESTELAVDATHTLTATVAPEEITDPEVSWSSSDESVATVDTEGVVTGVTEGTATITVTTADGGHTAQAEVTVTAGAEDGSDDASDGNDDAVAVTGVTLSAETLEVTVDATGTLTATVAPEDADDGSVSWSTSDETIATVDGQGVVTGVAAGTATITVTTTDGEFTAAAEVTVSEPVTVNSITLDDTTITMDTGSYEQLAATVDPEEAESAVTWSSSDESIVTFENITGEVQAENDGVPTIEMNAVAAGTATITATAGDQSATCEVTVIESPWDRDVELDDEESFSGKAGSDAELDEKRYSTYEWASGLADGTYYLVLNEIQGLEDDGNLAVIIGSGRINPDDASTYEEYDTISYSGEYIAFDPETMEVPVEVLVRNTSSSDATYDILITADEPSDSADPSDITVTNITYEWVTSGTVQLDWDDVPNATGYRIDVKNTADFETVKEIDAPNSQYAVSGLDRDGTAYTVFIYATFAGGDESNSGSIQPLP